jgi:hypothetical protein
LYLPRIGASYRPVAEDKTGILRTTVAAGAFSAAPTPASAAPFIAMWKMPPCTFDHAATVVPLAHRVTVADHAGRRRRLLATMNDGRCTLVATLPAWAERVVANQESTSP